ncbi:hypothetical protein ACWEOI_30100 [Nocardia sp. NPDC004340]
MLASRGDHITKLAFLAVIAVGVASISSCSRPGADSTTPDGAPQSAAPTRLPSFGDDVIAQMMVSADAAGPQWAPAGSATLGPGTQLTTQGVGQCTANYVFVDNVANVYLGEGKADDPAQGGWTHSLAAVSRSTSGDSGGAALDPSGRALGTLSTLGLAAPIVNNIGDLAHELDYARAHSGIPGLRLVLGTESFRPTP